MGSLAQSMRNWRKNDLPVISKRTIFCVNKGVKFAGYVFCSYICDMKKIILCLLCLLFVVPVPAQEQQSTTVKRKKVAVVLSGGGAKGMAHIGVLKVLEKAGIPIDYIVGTSMGSIVGGLYAIGYNAAALDSMVRTQDWAFLLSDKVDTRHQSLEERQKQNTYLLSKPLSINKTRSEQAGGIIYGQNLTNLFSKLTVGYHDSIDFNALPIPFACVATNLVDNSEVDFHSGWLTTAMRASMSIPAFFTPVRLDSMVLVDGGLRNNYPVDLAKKMGADIIIGVLVQSEAKTAGQLHTSKEIIGQLIDVNCKNKYEDNITMTDIPMWINVKGYSSTSFTKGAIDTLILRGEKAAHDKWGELMALKRRLGLDSAYRPKPILRWHSSGLQQKVKLLALDFENIDVNDQKFLIRRYHLNEGDSISSEQIDQSITALRGDLFYADAEYVLRQMPGGYWLKLEAKEKKISQINLGVRFDTEEMVALQANALFKLHTRAPMNLEFTGRLGKRMMARIEATFNPLRFKKFTLAYMFRRNDINVYQNGNRDFNFTYNYHNIDLSLLNVSGKNYFVDLTARWEYFDFRDILTGTDVNIGMNKHEHYYSYHLKMHYDSEDNQFFSTKGAKFRAEYGLYTDNLIKYKGSRPLNIISGSWQYNIHLNNCLILKPQIYGRILFDSDDVPFCYSNVIGGDWFGHYLDQQMPFAGIGNLEYVENAFTAVGMKVQQRIEDNNYIMFTASLAAHGDKFHNMLNSFMHGYSLSYAYNSIFGPLGASLGYASRTKELYFFINLGFVF